MKNLFPAGLYRWLKYCLLSGLLAAAGAAHGATINPQDPPDKFLMAVAQNMLQAVKDSPAALKGDPQEIGALVREYALPWLDMTKTTRLAAGRFWRDASAAQQQALTEAFTGTLVRTYSGAFTQVTPETSINLLPFRGDPSATDAVVRTTISRPNSPAINVDYRMGQSATGWKLYDLNVEGIWLIQNYRNQFAQEIARSGIDGLIAALDARK